MTSRVLCVGAVLSLICLWLGCGADNPLNRQAVSGTIKVDGNPLGEGSIDFFPIGNGLTNSGALIQNGQFEISAEKGLPPGEYTATVSAPDHNAPLPFRPAGGPPAPPPDLLPPDKNSQTVTVTEDGPNEFHLEFSTK